MGMDTVGRLALGLRAAVLSFVVTVLLVGGWTNAQPGPSRRDHRESPAAGLVARYHCWSGYAPKDMEGKLPGHAVIAWDGRRPFYGGDKAVHYALEHIFGHRYPKLTVHAFCR